MLGRGAELPVARVAEAGHDEADVIEPLVEGCHVNRDVGHRLGKPLDALRCRDQRQKDDPRNAGGLEDLAGTDRGAAGGEHRIDDDRQRGASGGGQFVVVLLRPEGGLVAIEADVPDLGIRNQFQKALGHAYGGGAQFFAMWVVGAERP